MEFEYKTLEEYKAAIAKGVSSSPLAHGVYLALISNDSLPDDVQEWLENCFNNKVPVDDAITDWIL